MSIVNKTKSLLFHYADLAYNKYYPPQLIFRSSQRKKLKNKHFSLFTPNCIGGYLYHQLGLPFISPTINMMIYSEHFKKMMLNLEHYMHLTPIVTSDPKCPNVPCGLIDDVIIHFTHYDSSEEGIKAWEKRKKRIDYNNIYVVLPDIGLTKQDIEDLQNVKCKKIVIFTSKNYGYKHCLYLPEFEGEPYVSQVLGKTLSGKWKFENYFDFVGWINSEDDVAQNFYIGKYSKSPKI